MLTRQTGITASSQESVHSVLPYHKFSVLTSFQAAHVIYDDVQDDAAALAAKEEFTQHIFTKVMTMQIWRPENERGGRHFVYTTRYAYFFIKLLNQLKDRAGLEMLIRRMKKKPGDFLNHAKLWEDICSTYTKVCEESTHE